METSTLENQGGYYFHEEQAPEGYDLDSTQTQDEMELSDGSTCHETIPGVGCNYHLQKTTGSKFPQILELKEVIY